jgi:Flp pilus assembly pilin Flp
MSSTLTASDEGATAVEYALMLALIFMVIVASVAAAGANVATWYANAAAVI